MGKWLEDHIIQFMLLIAGTVGAFFTAKMGLGTDIKELKDTVANHEKRINVLAKEIEKHKDGIAPHTNCAVHTAALTMLPTKVDKSVCDEIHKNTDRRFDDICTELSNLRDALLPLNEMKEALHRIEKKL